MKLWTDFDENESTAVGVRTIWLRFEPDAAQSLDLDLYVYQNCKADSAKSNERISMKFYE